jgi:histidinol-phosphate aminotransferase
MSMEKKMRFNKQLEKIKTYEGGKPIELVVREFGIKPEDIIKLASNENPFGTSKKVIKTIQDHAHQAYMYPDDSMTELKEALANKFQVDRKNLIIGEGSDQVIMFSIFAKANRYKKVLTSRTTFAMYEIYAKQVGAKVIKTPSHQHNLDEFLQIYKKEKDIGMIFLCLPNNPLGECLKKEDVFKFLQKIDDNTLVVIDGAYQDFASAKNPLMKIEPKELIERFPNTLYLGTFSKSYALGGMRVGYGIADEEIMAALYKMRPPFNVTTLSLKAAVTALEDEEFVNKTIENNFKEMKKYENFAKENKIDFIDSYTNFITFTFDDKRNSKEIAQILLKKGIIIRDLTSYGINGIRVTIGRPKQNDRFLKTFKEVLTT